MTGLAGKVAVVTGAQQGIGAAAALGLAAAGANLVVNYLDDENAAQSVAGQASALGVEAVAVQADIASNTGIEDLMTAADRLGGIDVLVNNAGIFPREDFFNLTEDLYDRVMGVNLKAAVFCTQAAAKRMAESGARGSIVNLSSSSAFRPSPRGVHYSCSKAGLLGLTRAAALALAPHGIRVNAIAPGLTDTAQPRDGMSEEEITDAAALIPLAGLSLPDDIADTIVFLASDTARRITGQTIHVNGGLIMN